MKFIAAAVQMLPNADKEANLKEAERWVRQSVSNGAQLVVLPEVFNFRGPQESNSAESIPGFASKWMVDIATELSIYFLAGSILETIPNEKKVYNTSLFFSPNGELLAKYRKIHLFDVQVNDEVNFFESDTRNPGEEVIVAQTEFCPMGLAICYDLRFPELFRKLIEFGAQVVFLPAAFTALTGKVHWEPLLRARAIENQVYIIAPDQIGQAPNAIATHGHSMIVDPWGKILAEAKGGPGVIYAEIDLDYLVKIRKELPSLSHRKSFLMRSG